MTSGRWLVLGLILVGFFGLLFTGSTIYIRFFYLGLLLSVASWIWTSVLGRSLTLNRSSRVQRASVGDVFEERFDVINGSRLFAPWIEVANESTLPFSSGSRLLTLVRGKQMRNYLARTWITRRGAFPLGPTKISVGDPFGLFRWHKNIPAGQNIVILPKIFEIQSFIFPRGLLPGGRVIRRKSNDVTPHASGIREYSHGDALKRIHWPSSVRRNQLMVKEFEQDPQAEVWLFLDTQKSVHFEKLIEQEEIPVESIVFGRKPKFYLMPSTLEYSVSITASLVHYFLGQKRSVGFVSAGSTFSIHPAERSDRQESKILETLAFVKADGELSIAALAAAQASQIPQGSSAILVTSSVRPDIIIAVDDLQRRHLRPVVILLNAKSFNGEQGSEELAQSLRERGVPVCLIDCGDDLTKALSDFSSKAISQDMPAWQRPVLSPLT
jgi:uncharacterized protein (DUF58 family)